MLTRQIIFGHVFVMGVRVWLLHTFQIWAERLFCLGFTERLLSPTEDYTLPSKYGLGLVSRLCRLLFEFWPH